ncbi:MAG: hypothetical protein RIC30_12725 [Marinoscillum sp.]|uniref:hypothetical protein n=1 Tax=Marinoscillum sp. TaxID=2024838 RepID=UPI0032FFDF9D
MITKSKESVTAVIVTLLFVLACSVAVYFFSLKNLAEDELTSEKVKTEKMLSEKLALSKEIEKLKGEIVGYKGKSADLDKKLSTLETQLQQKESELRNHTRKGESATADYKKQLADLQAIRNKLNEEIARQSEQLVALQKENGNLKSTIAMMEETHEDLVTRNTVLSQLISENYGVEAHKKRNKLTVNSKRTKEILLGFDVPTEMTEKLSFKITSPDGNTVASNNSKTITYSVKEDFEFSDSEVMASINDTFSSISDKSNKKRVVLTYKPEQKLAGGVYMIDIFSDSTFVGSSQIRLK